MWKVDQETSIDPLQAIATSAREVASMASEAAGLVVPNWLTQSQQQDLLDFLSGSGLKWYLLWRPIAAAAEWLARFPLVPPATTTRKRIGRIVALHLGLFECEFSIVEIVADPINGSVGLLPARLRTNKKLDFRSGTITDNLLQAVAKNQGVQSQDASVWRQLWTTPWLQTQLAAMRKKPKSSHPNCPAIYDTPALPLEMSESPAIVCNAGIEWKTVPFNQIKQWVDQQLQSVGPLEGAVVTGELASIMGDGGTLGAALLQTRAHKDRILVANDAHHSDDLLSYGAAKLCHRLAVDEPAFLTKLPTLRTVVSRVGEPEWISLLSDDDAYVEGGKKWSRPQPVQGIRIPGAKVLKLAVDHEDFEHVREASIDIPDEFSFNQEAELLVEITPAQGNARVEIVTIPRVKTRNPLTANLQKMTEVRNNRDQLVSPTDYIDLYPRISPPLLQRLSSPTAWKNIAEGLVIPLLRQPTRTWASSDFYNIKEELLKKRRKSGQLLNITAIGSDGHVGEYHEELNRLVEGVATALDSPDPRRREDATRLLAYTSTDHSVVATHIASFGKFGPRNDAEFRLVGNCLREPTVIRSFFSSCGHENLNSHQIRTVAELASYRADALEQVESQQINDLYDAISHEFHEYAESISLQIHFRYLTLCVAFLLRRRIYDDSFVPPDGQLAQRVKSTCLRVIQNHAAGRTHILGGSVDLPSVMRQLIEYVDREGRGAFVLAT
ncbi:hypothetical protein OAH18_03450 [bacterium]|nr:hypothetical protein [bacterium]